MPLPLFWVLFLLILLFRIFKKKKTANRLTWIALAWLFLISTPFLPDALLKPLENKYPSLTKTSLERIKRPTNILVLGAGFVNDLKLNPNDQLAETALSRLIEGIRIYQTIPESKIITSGFGNREKTTSAKVMAKTALLLGVDSSRLFIQEKPTRTLEEAMEYQRLFADTCQLIVVTSAIHMPRSMYLFHKAGLNPIAAPTNHLYKKSEEPDPYYGFPSSKNIKKMEAVIHEYVGLLWYKLGGS